MGCPSWTPVLTLASPCPQINTWLGTLCGEEDCSEASLQNATSSIQNGCATEISSGSSDIVVRPISLCSSNDR